MQSSLVATETNTPQPTAAEALRQGVRHVEVIDARDADRIQTAFKKKVPFVIENAEQNPHGVDVNFLKEQLGDMQVTCFNPASNSEHIQLDTVLSRIEAGEKYRLRADVSLGRRLARFFDTRYFDAIRSYALTLMDVILHMFAKKKWAIFLSTPSCKMSNHAHVNSVFVIQLEGKKTWHLDFRGLEDIEHKDLFDYDFLAEKRPSTELELCLEPGQVLYLPAYWFHYTDTEEVTLSMHYLFSEPMSYYLRPGVRSLFFYELLRRPLGMMKLALAKDNELGFGDKAQWLKTKTKEQLAFLAQSDYS